MAIAETHRGKSLKAEVRRVIRASRQRVFDAWTKPEEIMKWWGTPNSNILSAEADVQQGGSYKIRTTLCNSGEENTQERRETSATGEYLDVIPGQLLRFTWRPDWDTGEESIVTIELSDAPGGTELVLTHEGTFSEEWRNRYEQGWGCMMDRLATDLAK